MARMVMNLLDDWNLSNSDKLSLLAFPASIRSRSLHKYSDGTPLPDDPEVLKRAEHLIGIADALRTSFPLNEQMGTFWLHKINKRFRNRTPMTAMLQDGLNGIVSVRVHLDCSYDWEISVQPIDTQE
ncbi:MAG: DUF2384 domain-containing protein [Gammaproteobacteria bacterium]|nr:DUF2384 domain-containing protein [Gammaproteobacteria bacterium]MDH5800991.1 DUF2384 domain-containing protein [Gammaproteobacteria bacterium]